MLMRGSLLMSLLGCAILAAVVLRPERDVVLVSERPDFEAYSRHTSDKTDWQGGRFGSSSGGRVDAHLLDGLRAIAASASSPAVLSAEAARLDHAASALYPGHPLKERLERLAGFVEPTATGDEQARQAAALGFVFATDPRLFASYLDSMRPYPLVTDLLIDKRGFSVARTCILAESVAPICPPLGGRTVADIGTGVGPLLPFLVRATGGYGTVYAEDIDPDVLAFIHWAGEHGFPALERVRLVLGDERHTRLPAGRMDVAFVLCIDDLLRLHRTEGREADAAREFLEEVGRCLRPGGALIVLLHSGMNRDAEYRAHLLVVLERSGYRVDRVGNTDLGPYLQVRAIRP
jgi:SAM-dependent methyltransferase